MERRKQEAQEDAALEAEAAAWLGPWLAEELARRPDGRTTTRGYRERAIAALKARFEKLSKRGRVRVWRGVKGSD